jgi:hypothetical protein
MISMVDAGREPFLQGKERCPCATIESFLFNVLQSFTDSLTVLTLPDRRPPQTRQIHATHDVPCHTAELQRGPIFRFPMQHRLTPYGGSIHGDNQKIRKEFCDPGQER